MPFVEATRVEKRRVAFVPSTGHVRLSDGEDQLTQITPQLSKQKPLPS